jgi:broad specificity phosphatase PhoE
MKTVYLMRHGQTLFNVQHKIQGWCDAPLTEVGIKQAKVAAKWFKDNHIELDAAYCSTSERASDTLELITDLPYTRLKGLKEWNFGAYEGKDECLNPTLPYEDFFKQFGGETQDELQQRIVKTMNEIMENTKGKNVLVVSHGAACANFIRYYEEYNETHYKRGVKNCAIFKCTYENGIFSCKEIINHDFSDFM